MLESVDAECRSNFASLVLDTQKIYAQRTVKNSPKRESGFAMKINRIESELQDLTEEKKVESSENPFSPAKMTDHHFTPKRTIPRLDLRHCSMKKNEQQSA